MQKMQAELGVDLGVELGLQQDGWVAMLTH